MAVLYVPHFVQFFDNNGDPLAGGKLYTYAAGTTTPKATYTTAAGDVANTNPVVLDASGRAVLFIDGAYRFDLFTSADVLVKSTDNVTNFTTTGTASNAYFQSFSGDGATVAFTASEDLGTDEKLIFVFADLEYATNGAFASDTGWTKGAGWSIGSGVATAAGAISTALEQTAGKALIAGELYRVSMTVTRDAGTITPNLGGTAGTGRSSAGTYHENIIAGATQIISFTTSGFTGTIDNVSVTKVSGQEILKTSDYTIDGTTLTLTVPPTTGTNNVQVWAPTKLANAASASASAAATSEANAATSETNAATSETNAGTSETNAAASALAAAASAAKLSGTSTTSLAIGTGSKAFTTQADKFFDVGAWLLITSDADPANYMHGQVTAYSGTSLTVNVTNVGGSGTLDDWTIRVAGTRGATGATGASGGPLSDGDYGDIVVSGTGTVMTLDIAGATSGTVASDDEILFADVGSSDVIRKTTAGAIAALAPAQDYEFVSSATASNSSSLDFTGLEAGYDYIFVCHALRPASDGVDIAIRTSTDGATYSSGATDYEVYGGGEAAQIEGANTVGNAADEFYSGVWTAINPGGSTQKVFTGHSAGKSTTGTLAVAVEGGIRKSTTAITAVRFFFVTGNITTGSICMFRRKNS